MLKSIAILFFITLIPGLELRASIPMGILGGKWIQSPLAWPAVVITCTVSNILIGWAVYFLLEPIILLFRRMPFADRLLTRYLDRAREKLRPGVEKYGLWGLAVFIGIPLPLTGAITGAAGAFALGMEKKRFMLSCAIGVCLAAICVTAITLLIRGGCNLPIFKYLISNG